MFDSISLEEQLKLFRFKPITIIVIIIIIIIGFI